MTQRGLRTEQLDYELPQALIAGRPAAPRDSARMLVMSRTDESIEHARVRDLAQFLHTGDALVMNTTAVARARLVGRRVDTEGRVEGLFVEEQAKGKWRVMLRSNGRLRGGMRVVLLDAEQRPSEYELELCEPQSPFWTVELSRPEAAEVVLGVVGRTPLPPYILRARGFDTFADALDRAWYETVYADPKQRRSIAAPTAGLHFTPSLLRELEECGVQRLDVTLQIGPGTFTPISAPLVEEHRMDVERYEVPAATLAALRVLRGDAGTSTVGWHGQTRLPMHGAQSPPRGRVLAVGTTALRTLESLPEPLPDAGGVLRGQTQLFIVPPYRFKHVDGMLTNFHLPRTSLLALVAAMVGLERLLDVYRQAIEERYRFYSYGDSMLILP